MHGTDLFVARVRQGWGGDTVSAERPAAVGASKPEPHPEAQELRSRIRLELLRLDDSDRALAALDVLVGRLEQAELSVDLYEAMSKAIERALFGDDLGRSRDELVERAEQAREALGVPPPGGPDS
jgi:hypothetical protein